MIPPPFPFPLKIFRYTALTLAMTLASVAASGDFSLSASLNLDDPTAILFEGDSTEAQLEVIAHPVDATTWTGIKVRFVVAKLDGERLISSTPANIKITKPGNSSQTTITLNRWYTASYLGLKKDRSSLTTHISYRRSSKEPVEFFVEVDSERAEEARTAPLDVRCCDLDFIDAVTEDPDDDITIGDEDTAWITHEEDATNVVQLMPRLRAEITSLTSDYTVHWRYRNSYARRKGIDDRAYPAEGFLQLPGNQPWNLHAEFGTEFFGGDGILTYKIIDKSGKQIREGERKFKILSRNPSDSAAKKIIAQERGKYWFAEAISMHESRQGRKVFNQFNTLGRVVNQPNFGAPDAWGLFQIDSARGKEVTTTEAWDWRANVQAGIEEFQKAESDIQKYLEALQRTYPEQYEPPPTHITPEGTKTQLTFEEISVIQLYNGAAVVKKLKTKWDTLSYYRGAFQFYPGNPSGQRWKFIPNKMDYVQRVLKEYEGKMTTETD